MLAAREVERAEALLVAPGGVGVVKRSDTLQPAGRGRPCSGAAVVVGGADVGARASSASTRSAGRAAQSTCVRGGRSRRVARRQRPRASAIILVAARRRPLARRCWSSFEPVSVTTAGAPSAPAALACPSRAAERQQRRAALPACPQTGPVRLPGSGGLSRCRSPGSRVALLTSRTLRPHSRLETVDTTHHTPIELRSPKSRGHRGPSRRAAPSDISPLPLPHRHPTSPAVKEREGAIL